MVKFRYTMYLNFIFMGVILLEKWFIKNRPGDLNKISKANNISKFLSKLLINRKITDDNLIKSYLDPNIDRLHKAELMKDLEKGTMIIKEKIESKEKIRVIGDFDVDGVMSVYILFKGIKRLGGLVDYVIPDRISDGYGININIVRDAQKDGINTIITCDNGIAAIEAVKFAKDIGLNVIITDHHDMPYTLNKSGEKKYIHTDADAVINPKQYDCKYPFKMLCGAGIAFKFIEKLYSIFNIPEKESFYLLEYAAIATVCDIVDLIDENRIIVKEGLKLLNNTKNIGLKALMKETGIDDKEISTYHLGFVIGPSINASGRLDSALKALDLLLAKDIGSASLIAKELRELNDERKKFTFDGVDKIDNTIKENKLLRDKVLVIYEPEIHESVAGIIAGRIKDKYNRPTLVLTKGKEGVKGSGRSIEKYNMFEELNKCKNILLQFGGHPMAAGLSLEEDNIQILRDTLNNNTKLTEDDLIFKKYIDMQLSLDYISYKLIEELKVLEPFGKGNNKPLFGDKNLNIKKGFVLGKNRNVLKLILENNKNRSMEAIYFGDIKKFEDSVIENHSKEGLNKIYSGINNSIFLDILYYPTINEYRGNTNLQITIQSFRISI